MRAQHVLSYHLSIMSTHTSQYTETFKMRGLLLQEGRTVGATNRG